MSKQSRKDILQLRSLDFDLANYFSNTIIPQLFVDADLILRVFTPPAMEQFSLSYDDIGRRIDDVKDNLRYPTIVENIQEVIATSQVFEREIQTTDGNWFQMNILPYMDHEKDTANGVIITFVDITKRLAAIKELEKINSQHQVLLYALSHDVKQPISVLKLLTVGLRETYKRQNQEQFVNMVERLEATAKAMISLLEDYTKTGEINLEEKENPLEIKKICKDVLDSLREEIVECNISIVEKYQALNLRFPKNHLRSIIYNLIHNAIKYRDCNRDSIIQISTFKSNGFIVLSVEDNGIGIAKKHQNTIFQKSSRINDEIDGTGMGLYIIHKMVETNNGRIKVESKVGEGSKFLVFFKDDPSLN